MSYNYGFPKYVPVAERRMNAQKTINTLKKKNPNLQPVVIDGGKIAKTWWGKAWNDNLERYSDYENRIGRGRSYLRNGAVLDLQITSGKISALVQGSRAKPYDVTVIIKPLAEDIWKKIIHACEGKLDSIQELMEGKFPKALADTFTAQGKGLFPAPKEISFDCSCPDWAVMCKHVAAVLYGVGARLDHDPALFFHLRQVNVDQLISETITQKSQTMLKKSALKSNRVIDDADISALFGIDFETASQESINNSKVKQAVKTKQELKTKESKKKQGITIKEESKTRKVSKAKKEGKTQITKKRSGGNKKIG
jgi:uncharacterized Zn finger protein